MKASAKRTSLVGADEELVSSNGDRQLLGGRITGALTTAAKLLEVDKFDLQMWFDNLAGTPELAKLKLLHLIVRYRLDPLCEEVSLVQVNPEHWIPIITIDGWTKLINQHAAFSGVTFSESPQMNNGLPIWMECTIYRKDRVHPISVREYFSEVSTEHEAWKKMPRRMLRYRTLQQSARLAFGISGASGVEMVTRPQVNKGAPVNESMRDRIKNLDMAVEIDMPYQTVHPQKRTDVLKKLLNSGVVGSLSS
jgi:hypothetical protein